MADTGKKIRELTEAAELNGTDNLVVEDSAPKTKRTTLSKISDWLKNNMGLKAHAFSETIKNLTTTVSGSALDATMGKTLQDNISNIGKLLYSETNTGSITSAYSDVGGARLILPKGRYLITAKFTSSTDTYFTGKICTCDKNQGNLNTIAYFSNHVIYYEKNTMTVIHEVTDATNEVVKCFGQVNYLDASKSFETTITAYSI